MRQVRHDVQDSQPNVSLRKSNTQDVSARGAFIISYQDLEPDTPITVELHDLTESPLVLNASVRGIRRWDQGQELPGIGIAFDQSPDDYQKLVDGLARQQLEEMLASSNRPLYSEKQVGRATAESRV